jgi:hypothetical protein
LPSTPEAIWNPGDTATFSDCTILLLFPEFGMRVHNSRQSFNFWLVVLYSEPRDGTKTMNTQALRHDRRQSVNWPSIQQTSSIRGNRSTPHSQPA